MRSVSGVFLARVRIARVQSSHRMAAGWQLQRQFYLLLLHRETALGRAFSNKGTGYGGRLFYAAGWRSEGLSTQGMRISDLAGFAY